jgi:peptidoglycan/LPS O-acetylase OafA/YrhL
MVAGLLVFRRGWQVSTGTVAAAWAAATVYLGLTGPHFEGYVAHNVVMLPVLVLTIMHLAGPATSTFARLLASEPMRYLGRISYGFYIWQLVFFIICDVQWDRHVLDNHSPFAGVMTFGVVLVSSVISYHLLEKPARHAILQQLRPSSAGATHT